MSASTLVSRLTGFLRTWAMGYALGVTALADSYDVANNLPNMLFELLAGGVLSSVFIPLFMERLRNDGDEDAWKFASYVLNIFVLVLGTIAAVATIWPQPFVYTQTLTISAEKAQMAVWLFRFFAVQIVFYGAGLVFTGILNSYRRFLAPAIAPIFNNVVVTVTLLGFYVPFHDSNPDLALTGLAVGTTLGVLAMALVQVPSLLKLGGHYTFGIDWHHPGLRNVGAKMLPTLVYVITNMVSVTFRTNFALSTGEGGQAALRYAWQFYQLPYGIFAVALATAIFPELAERANARDMGGFKKLFGRGIRATMALIVPLAALLALLSTPVITLYQAGRFTADAVPLVAGVLFWWALTLPFFAGYMYVLKSFYSLQDTKTPMNTNIIATVVHVGLYALLVRGIGGWDGLGLVGIPISDGIFYLGHMLALMLILRARVGALDGRAIATTFGKIGVASAGGTLVAWFVARATGVLSGPSSGFAMQLLLAGAAGVVGLAVAYALMAALRVPELAMITDKVTSRLRRGRGSR